MKLRFTELGHKVDEDRIVFCILWILLPLMCKGLVTTIRSSAVFHAAAPPSLRWVSCLFTSLLLFNIFIFSAYYLKCLSLTRFTIAKVIWPDYQRGWALTVALDFSGWFWCSAPLGIMLWILCVHIVPVMGKFHNAALILHEDTQQLTGRARNRALDPVEVKGSFSIDFREARISPQESWLPPPLLCSSY